MLVFTIDEFADTSVHPKPAEPPWLLIDIRGKTPERNNFALAVPLESRDGDYLYFVKSE
jgi:hypothetical protein